MAVCAIAFGFFDFRLAAWTDKELSVLGLATSVITVAIGRVAERPATRHLRAGTFTSLLLLWLGIILCLCQFIVSDLPSAFVFTDGWTKVGLLFWFAGIVVCMLMLREAFGARDHLEALPFRLRHGPEPFEGAQGERRWTHWFVDRCYRLTRFHEPDGDVSLGMYVLDYIAQRFQTAGHKNWFPVVLNTERGVSALKTCQMFLISGMERGYGAVYITMARPASIVVEQLKSRAEKEGRTPDLEEHLIVVDGFTPLHFTNQAASRRSGPGSPTVLLGDPSHPAHLLRTYKTALHRLRKTHTHVRVVCDSLTELLLLTDAQQANAFLRHITVFDELWRVQSLYISWCEVEGPASDDYIAFVSNTFLHLRKDPDTDAVLVGVGAATHGVEQHAMRADLSGPWKGPGVSAPAIAAVADLRRAAIGAVRADFDEDVVRAALALGIVSGTSTGTPPRLTEPLKATTRDACRQLADQLGAPQVENVYALLAPIGKAHLATAAASVTAAAPAAVDLPQADASASKGERGPASRPVREG